MQNGRQGDSPHAVHKGLRTLAADVKTLEANSNFPESENKNHPERVDENDGGVTRG
jgi:hypothetical protein